MKIYDVKFVGFDTAIDIDSSVPLYIKSSSTLNCANGIVVKKNSNPEEDVMGLKVDGCTFDSGKFGIRAPDNYNVEVTKTNFIDIDTGIDIYIKEHALLNSGLAEDTLKDMLATIINDVRKLEHQDEKVKLIASSRLRELLGVASDTVTVMTPFVSGIIAMAAS